MEKIKMKFKILAMIILMAAGIAGAAAFDNYGGSPYNPPYDVLKATSQANIKIIGPKDDLYNEYGKIKAKSSSTNLGQLWILPGNYTPSVTVSFDSDYVNVIAPYGGVTISDYNVRTTKAVINLRGLIDPSNQLVWKDRTKEIVNLALQNPMLVTSYGIYLWDVSSTKYSLFTGYRMFTQGVPTGSAPTVNRMWESSAGSIFAFTNDSNRRRLERSTDKGLTWTVVLDSGGTAELPTSAGGSQNRCLINLGSNRIIFTDYTETTLSKKVFYSADDGATWSTLFDVGSSCTAIRHWHGGHYDSVNDELFLFTGDNAYQCSVLYCDDPDDFVLGEGGWVVDWKEKWGLDDNARSTLDPDYVLNDNLVAGVPANMKYRLVDWYVETVSGQQYIYWTPDSDQITESYAGTAQKYDLTAFRADHADKRSHCIGWTIGTGFNVSTSNGHPIFMLIGPLAAGGSWTDENARIYALNPDRESITEILKIDGTGNGSSRIWPMGDVDFLNAHILNGNELATDTLNTRIIGSVRKASDNTAIIAKTGQLASGNYSYVFDKPNLFANAMFTEVTTEVKQKDTFTPNGTIESSDIFILTATSEDRKTSVAISYTGGDSAATVSAGLIAAWNASADALCTPVTASGTTTVILEADVAGIPFNVVGTTTETGGGAADDQTFTRVATTANASPPKDWSGVASALRFRNTYQLEQGRKYSLRVDNTAAAAAAGGFITYTFDDEEFCEFQGRTATISMMVYLPDDMPTQQVPEIRMTGVIDGGSFEDKVNFASTDGDNKWHLVVLTRRIKGVISSFSVRIYPSDATIVEGYEPKPIYISSPRCVLSPYPGGEGTTSRTVRID